MLAKTKIGSLNEILASRAKMTWRRRLNFDDVLLTDLDLMKEWCEKNCKGIWRCEQYYACYFQFDNDEDAMMFAMKFSGKGLR